MTQNPNWFEVKGDETYALDWPLNEDSHVWEIGGFAGRWAQQIWDKFHCNITIFEPQLWAVERMQERFKGNNKIEIHPYGLLMVDETREIGSYETDGAGIFSTKEPMRRVVFKGFYNEIINIPYTIDLCLMNIEGAEYPLIANMLASNIFPFDNFWCQFHPGFIPSEEEERKYIFDGIGRTHDKIWDFFPTAVAWRRR